MLPFVAFGVACTPFVNGSRYGPSRNVRLARLNVALLPPAGGTAVSNCGAIPPCRRTAVVSACTARRDCRNPPMYGDANSWTRDTETVPREPSVAPLIVAP